MNAQRSTTGISYLRYDGRQFSEVSAEVATEFVLTVFVGGREFATIVCTPSDLEELLVGFLASEGVIAGFRDIASCMIDADKGFAYVELPSAAAIDPLLFSRRRISSCCGKGRQSYYFASDALSVRHVRSDLSLTPEQCLAFMAELSGRSGIHRLTSGVHNAGICEVDGQMRVYSDIGRHNALDKIYGASLMRGEAMDGKALAISGRISSEMALKAAKIGSPILLSKSAPTDLALRIADEYGITAVGFIRGDIFNVYTHPHRIVAKERDGFT